MDKNYLRKKPSKQICVHKGKKSLLEFLNCMQPPSIWYPWHLHAEGIEDEGKPSLIRLVMVDYTDRENTKSVYANLKPKEVKWLFHQICTMIQEVSFMQQKIYREDKSSMEGIVTCLSITRHEKDGKGIKREQPWYVEIRNGTGTAARNRVGGEYCQKGSFCEKQKVSINLNDADAYMLFDEVVTVIRQCEKEHLFHRRDVENLSKLLKRISKMMVNHHNDDNMAA